jgi:hypothetical protein
VATLDRSHHSSSYRVSVAASPVSHRCNSWSQLRHTFGAYRLSQREVAPLLPPPPTPHELVIPLSIPHLSHMSHTHTTSISSSDFQIILHNALKAYERRTKKDLLVHPLASQLEACESPGTVLSLLRQQVSQLNQSQRSNERLIRWLDPIVNVLYSFSATLGEDFGLVCLKS